MILSHYRQPLHCNVVRCTLHYIARCTLHCNSMCATNYRQPLHCSAFHSSFILRYVTHYIGRQYCTTLNDVVRCKQTCAMCIAAHCVRPVCAYCCGILSCYIALCIILHNIARYCTLHVVRCTAAQMCATNVCVLLWDSFVLYCIALYCTTLNDIVRCTS